MKRTLSTLTAALLVASLGLGIAQAKGPWAANKGNTWGWTLMTAEEAGRVWLRQHEGARFSEVSARPIEVGPETA